MLALRPEEEVKKCVPNLLPCTIKYSGPVAASEQHWDPKPASNTNDATTATETIASSNEQVAYLRGRKLRGKVVELPPTYKGHVLERSQDMLATSTSRNSNMRETDAHDDQHGEEEEELPIEVRLLKQQAHFDKIMVWSHEAVPESDDPYVKGIQEWMTFSQAVSVAVSKYKRQLLNFGVQIHSYDQGSCNTS